MTGDEGGAVVHRILIALDASRHSQAAMEAALELSSHFKSELIGLYVEDANLVRLAEMPLMQEICGVSARPRRFDLAEVERQFHAQAALLRQALRKEAERWHVRWSFEVRRGSVARTLVSAASEVDLIVLGRSGRSFFAGRQPGSACRLVLTQAPRTTMVVARGARLGFPLVVAFDGSPQGRRALDLARYLHSQAEGPMVVLLAGANGKPGEALRADASGLLGDAARDARFRTLAPATASRLAQEVSRADGGTLIVPASESLLDADAVMQLLSEVDAPVLLVR